MIIITSTMVLLISHTHTHSGPKRIIYIYIYNYVINYTTDLTAYSLEHYDEVKDIDDCHLIYKTTGKYYNKDKSGKRYTHTTGKYYNNVIPVSPDKATSKQT